MVTSTLRGLSLTSTTSLSGPSSSDSGFRLKLENGNSLGQQQNSDRASLSLESTETGAGALNANFLGGLADNFSAKADTPASDASAKKLDIQHTLKRGSRGEEVKELQRALNARTGGKLEVDGIFGPQTLAAVKRLQQGFDLNGDGIVGKKTLAKLQEGSNKASDQNAGPESSAASPKADQTQESQNLDGDKAVKAENLPEKMRHLADAYNQAGQKYGVDPRFLAAISKFETGSGTSKAFNEKNNAMGISNSRGPIQMESHEQSIERMAKKLSSQDGPYAGAHTIGAIGNIYSPPGAENDPNGTNGEWPSTVGKFYAQLGGDPSQRVTGINPGLSSNMLASR
jgi:flagellum-specific peptidoglycan hydrolase FlgJ